MAHRAEIKKVAWQIADSLQFTFTAFDIGVKRFAVVQEGAGGVELHLSGIRPCTRHKRIKIVRSTGGLYAVEIYKVRNGQILPIANGRVEDVSAMDLSDTVRRLVKEQANA